MFYAITSLLTFALMPILAKIGLGENIAPLEMVLARYYFFLPIFWLWVSYSIPKRALKAIPRGMIASAILAGIAGYYIVPVAGITGLSYISASLEAIIYGCFPGMVLILNAFYSKKMPQTKHVLVFAITQLGIFIAMRAAGDLSIARENWIGAAWALVSAFAMAVYFMLNQHAGKAMRAVIFTGFAMLGGLSMALFHTLMLGHGLPGGFTTIGWTSVIAAALLLAVGNVLFTRSVRILGAARTALIHSLNPIATIVFAHLFLRESLLAEQWFGGLIVVGAITWLEWRLYKERKK